MRSPNVFKPYFSIPTVLFLSLVIFFPTVDFPHACAENEIRAACGASFPAAAAGFIAFLLLAMSGSVAARFYSNLKTSEKKAHELLAASEERFRLMIENTPVGVCILDEYGVFEYVNDAFARLYEYEHDELVGKHMTFIILENLYEISMRNYNDFINGNIPLSREWSAASRSGRKLTVLVNSAKITDLCGKCKSILFIADITERQKAEQELIESRKILEAARDSAETLNRQKSRFLASVSHDIRTPLNSIIGFSDLLERSPLDDEQKKMVRCLKNSGGDLLALINDILDLSKIEAGKLEIVNDAFDVAEILQDAVNSISPLAEKKGVKVSLWIDAALMDRVVCDAHRYKQIANNLLSNAVKFTSKGEVRAELKVVAQNASFYTLQTSVSDSGIGIEPEMLGRLFVPFDQCGRSVSRQYGGTGLGLAISAQLVKLIGGDEIRVESEAGRGSRFYFNLNLEKAGPRQEAKSPAVQPAGAIKERAEESPKLNILVADDSEINIMLITTILSGKGHTVLCARDGEEAVEIAGGSPIDLILMDVNMPKLDGFGAAARIRARGIAAPVIAITAAAMQEDIINCRRNGMDDVVTKPLIYDSFVSKINEYAKKIKSRRRPGPEFTPSS